MSIIYQVENVNIKNINLRIFFFYAILYTGDIMTFGERLRKCRKEKGLTQKELAALIGERHTSVSHWEKDQNVPDGNKILLLIKALDVKPEELVGDYDLNALAELEEEERENPSKLSTEQRAALEYARAISSDVWKGTVVPGVREVVGTFAETVDDVTREMIDIMKDLAAEQKKAVLDLVKAMHFGKGGKGDK